MNAPEPSGARRRHLDECEIGDWKIAAPADPVVPGLVHFEGMPTGVPENRKYFKRERRTVDGLPNVAVWVRVAEPVRW